MNLQPKILFEDSSILVLDKPAGLVVDKSETQTVDTVEHWLEEREASAIIRQGIVHRLDKDTSGILLIAKTSEALENLQAQFKNRTVTKEYVALAHGILEKPILVEGAIGRNPGNREKFIVLEEGKEASTEFIPEKNLELTDIKMQEIFKGFNKIQMRKLNNANYGQFTLLKCKPKTGRTHQIRVHLKYIEHPIVADEKYSGRKTFRLDKRWCPRQFLHAAKIEFKHPETGKQMEFEIELPEDLKKALLNLSLNQSSRAWAHLRRRGRRDL